MSDRDDATLAAELVREAGRLALRMRAVGVSADRKTNVSDLVTAADRAAEEYVVSRLAAERPDDAVVGEEGTDQVGSTGRTWVIDPVDGTWNFFHGLGWWCSALALDGPQPLGAVHAPHDDATWVGGPGRPTTRDGVPLEPLADAGLDGLAVATYLHPTYLVDAEVYAAWSRVARRAATQRMLGSGSRDLAAVSEGALGLWFQHSVPAWDWLPGKALVEGVGGVAAQVEAGGVVWSVAGPPRAVSEALALLLE